MFSIVYASTSASMPNVSITPEMEREIEQAIGAGEYTSVSEIVREGLRLWRQNRVRDDLALRLLGAEIEIGWQQADRGQLVDYDIQETIKRVKARLATGR